MLDEYEISIKRSKRKTASIYIERDGAVTALVPERLDNDRVNEILKQNEYKIHKYQSRRILLNKAAVKREPVNGQSFLYLGRNYYLQYSDKVDEIRFHGRYFLAPVGISSRLQHAFKEFYRNRGKEFLTPRVHKYAAVMGVYPEEVSILDLKNRWASCSTKKPKVNFHWKIMMAPVSVIEYVVVHELAHFKYKRHSAQFWNGVDKVIPDYLKQIAWLKQKGASLDL
ncbi:MAG: M48 family metallopeptidase [Planctomycetes bacterium]|nr:M48 family metallopeptidase [Planctomycetota bacterium]